ncbi:ASCH domain-containing protein [Agromyces endophyticus]|uniref:ASCH domain-containing protein n=1 Tax=Agromyces sp. H17E-10 TaxID=2932244 RepID=UPI001FD070EF|nr:ASCH domain-containing protein [Agromyces sp. H17E-10]UOQ91099.1 ASCH domain-containing protein [Agromyces sp. H17E-10]
MTITASPEALTAYWREVRSRITSLPAEIPEAWPFGATAEHADGLLELVLAGIKTGTASSVWDYEETGERVPEAGDLSIILDGGGSPRAVIRTTSVRVVPFDEVDEEHARSEGEGDRTLRAWREIHERYWREHSENPRGFAPDMPVLCERFELVDPVG